MFDAARIRRETFVAEVEIHDELDSTNDLALQKARNQTAASPLLIVAKRQTAGRGRGANRWWSSDGALTFSLLLDHPPQLPIGCWPQISLTVGLAVCEALLQLRPGLPIGLKWPNDVHVDGRKIGGSLIEVPPQAGRLVIGVGVNVNNSLIAAPTELRQIAISLRDVAQHRFDINQVLIFVLRQMAEHLKLLAAGQIELQRRWQQLCVLAGRRVQVALGTRQVSGWCEGIDHDGALIIQTPAGPQRCIAGVVQRIE
jgi:BirA family biotin operon repressor/biotin-[acetyl-CoA-carboxylase] ligase